MTRANISSLNDIEITEITDLLKNMRLALDEATAMNAVLVENLTNLCGLAAMRPGHLHEYKAAVEQANAAIKKATGQ